MSSLTFIAPGGVSTFNIPVHNKTATATVNGSAATLSAQGDNSVTFQSTPSQGDAVVISYTEVQQNAHVIGKTNAATGAVTGFQVGSDLLPAFGKTYTWVARPDATQLSGAIIFVSDIGGGAFFRSNGTRWKPVSAILPLAEQHTAVTFAADTNENTGFTFTVPAGLVMQNDSLEVYASFTHTNNANQKTGRVKLGGTLAMSSFGASGAGSGVAIALCNRNSVTSQAVKNLASGVTSINTAIAVDMSVAQNLTVTMQKATAGDTVTLESVSVYLVRSAQ